MRLRTTFATLVALGATAASAQAAEISSGVDCVRVVEGQQTMLMNATGFTPLEFVTFSAEGQTLQGGYADEAGSMQLAILPPVFSPSDRLQQTFQVTASDPTGITAPPIAVPMTQITVLAPKKSKPERLVRWRLFGFASAQPVWLFVRRGGKTLRRVKVGTTDGPCGTLTKRMRFLPLKRYRAGTYTYAFSHSRTYSESTYYYSLSVRIFRTFR